MTEQNAEFGAAGALLWHSYVDLMDLDPGELANLREACHQLDECERIQSLIEQSAPLVKGSTGQPKVNPLYKEIREHRKVLLKLLAQIKVPSAHEVGSPSVVPANVISLAARAAARARWAKEKG